MKPVLCLASASPRRQELLRQIGVPHVVSAPNIDEHVRDREPPDAYVLRMAREKAAAVWASTAARRDLPVLGADTAVVLDNQVLGKPADALAGFAMLRLLSGGTHRVLTGVALRTNDAELARLSSSEVTFRAVTDAEARSYWESGEPRDKAGGYAIQGRGAIFVEKLQGSYSGVMGLPLYEVAGLLREAGVPLDWSAV